MTPFLKSFSKRQNTETYRGYTYIPKQNYWIKKYPYMEDGESVDMMGIVREENGVYEAVIGEWDTPETIDYEDFFSLEDAIDWIENEIEEWNKFMLKNSNKKVKSRSVKSNLMSEGIYNVDGTEYEVIWIDDLERQRKGLPEKYGVTFYTGDDLGYGIDFFITYVYGNMTREEVEKKIRTAVEEMWPSSLPLNKIAWPLVPARRKLKSKNVRKKSVAKSKPKTVKKKTTKKKTTVKAKPVKKKPTRKVR